MQCRVILFKAREAAASKQERRSRPNLNDLSECLFRHMSVTLLVITSVSKASTELSKSFAPKKAFKELLQHMNSCREFQLGLVHVSFQNMIF